MGAGHEGLVLRITKHLCEVPYKLSKLLGVMKTSASHFDYLCSGLLKQDSELYQHINSPGRMNHIMQTVTVLREAIDEMNEFLSPIAEELPDKLERLVVGIEQQLIKDKAIVGGNASTQQLASFEARRTTLSTDPQPLSTLGTCSTSLEKSAYTDSIEAMLLGSEALAPYPGILLWLGGAKKQMRAHIERRMFPGPKPVLYGSVMCAHLELVLFYIRTYYTKGNFQPELTVSTFSKFTDLPKAQQSLRESLTVNSDDVFGDGSAVALVEILSTLSPINTAVNPQFQKTLLAYLYKLVIKHLPRWSIAVSVRALTFIVDRLRANLDPVNQLRMLAEEILTTLLRRGHYDEALYLARRLEHNYITQCKWDLAFDVYFKIVGQQPFDTTKESMPDPQSHDEWAVWTMEDIAKIYDCVGNFNGGICWGAGVRLEHIHDKLLKLQKRHELNQETQLWSTTFGPAWVDIGI
ncbi:hypothetical protein TRIATDRAFT_83527 [Trichoderma atroviride IMI 206040]|uniref:Uncharacterized protein n=1 Tax=Hypocrea atroviridis (strain ATCC 20476 / IMI 206040) TaxID=452589 RepID=G9NL10_HYPAI|nr:uncharacterized protein TRIATDRAFT_83527 [Trichoderma atroviride IMI 206040]EHK48578.1 hypothetical protein TRIATDRAFT_83527 [Trichoderma atroviride IMI 206040]